MMIRAVILSGLMLLGCVAQPVFAADEAVATSAESKPLSVQQLYQRMQQTVRNQDYALTIIKTDSYQLNETYRYRHVLDNNQNYAQLLYLEGPAREIILKNNIISYFQMTGNPFSLPGKRIVEAFPDVIFNNINSLKENYDLFLIGKARTANSPCQLIRIVAKDKDRYSYIIWIDEQSYFPLRIDLVDGQDKLLENIKVVDMSSLAGSKADFLDYLNSAKVPSLLADSSPTEKKSNYWSLEWLPSGFKAIRSSTINFQTSQFNSQTYSDGVFYFSVYIDDMADDFKQAMLKLNNRVILTTKINNHNVVIIGNLPAATIQKIAKYIVINEPK